MVMVVTIVVMLTKWSVDHAKSLIDDDVSRGGDSGYG